jgi:phosphomannomutase/phosphomannomutase/phosphoglucomutase
MVTASHNPKDYNGMKLVRSQSQPISGDTGLKAIQNLAETQCFSTPAHQQGALHSANTRPAYIQHLLSYLDTTPPKLKIVVNAGNGAAGPVIDALAPHLPSIEFIKIHHQPDGNFPNGIPNPLLPENRTSTTTAILEHQADLGIAWDGDFDRCFLFDATGRFIEGYYIVGLLAEAFLSRYLGAKIVHDPRLTWNTLDIVKQMGGIAVQSKTGHAFIKERMRLEDAVYGGEMSAHHYFRDFAYCDSGMIPWLLVVGLIGKTGKTLAQLLDQRLRLFPASGEINRSISDPATALSAVQNHYQAQALEIDFTDGLSMEFADWRFNLRCSNTEPLVRLNVESRGNEGLMRDKTTEILEFLAKSNPNSL